MGWDKDASQLPSRAKQTPFGELNLFCKHMQVRTFQKHEEELPYCAVGWALDQVAWRGGGVSLTGEIPKLFWARSLLVCSSQEVGLNDCWCSLPTLPIIAFLDSNLQAVQMFDRSFSQDIHPDVQSKPLLNKLTSSSSWGRNREAWGRCGFPFIQQEAQVALLNKQRNLRRLIISTEISCRSLCSAFTSLNIKAANSF